MILTKDEFVNRCLKDITAKLKKKENDIKNFKFDVMDKVRKKARMRKKKVKF